VDLPFCQNKALKVSDLELKVHFPHSPQKAILFQGGFFALESDDEIT